MMAASSPDSWKEFPLMPPLIIFLMEMLKEY